MWRILWISIARKRTSIIRFHSFWRNSWRRSMNFTNTLITITKARNFQIISKQWCFCKILRKWKLYLRLFCLKKSKFAIQKWVNEFWPSYITNLLQFLLEIGEIDMMNFTYNNKLMFCRMLKKLKLDLRWFSRKMNRICNRKMSFWPFIS